MDNVFSLVSYGFYSLLEISIVVCGIVILFYLAERARENCIDKERRLEELRTREAAEAEKSRVRKAVEAEMSRIAAELISKIDYFIRTRNRFDSRYPLAYCCDRRWESGSTWRDKWQKCQGCESECYPYAQHILHQKEVTEGKDDRKPHHINRCQKCIESGRLYVPRMYFVV